MHTSTHDTHGARATVVRVTDDELTEANSLLAGVENLAWMVGPIVGGGLLATSGTDAAYLINAATFLVSAAIVVRIPAGRLQSEQSLSRGHWRDVRDGLELVRGSRQLLTVLVVWNVVLLGNACVNVAEVVFAKGSLGTGNVGLGVLVGSTGLGLTIGSFLAPTALGTLGLRKVYVGSIALMAMGWGVASAAPELWVAVPLVVVATIGNGCALVCNQLLVQRGAPDQLRGRALAVILSSFYVTLGIGMAVAGPLIDVFGARETWAIGGAAYLVGSFVAFAMTAWLGEAESAPAAAGVAPPVPEPPRAAVASSGFERLLALLDEVERTRRVEAERAATRPRLRPIVRRRAPEM